MRKLQQPNIYFYFMQNRNKITYILGGIALVAIIAGILIMVFKSSMIGNPNGSNSGDTARLYQAIANLSSPGNAGVSGIVQAGFVDGKYRLVAAFAGIPDPKAGYFYAGWLRKENSPDAVSTGKVEKINSIYSNVLQVDKDLSEFSTYTLTLQPENDEEQIGETVMEGKLNKK